MRELLCLRRTGDQPVWVVNEQMRGSQENLQRLIQREPEVDGANWAELLLVKEVFMSARCFLSVLIVLLTIGCGGGDPNVASGDDVTSDGTLSAVAQNRSVSGAAGAGDDETAANAKQYCDNEVKKGTQNPVALLDKKQISACLIALRPTIKAECTKNVKREIVLKIIIGKDGSVVGAFPVGDGADSVEAACVAEKVKPAIFPSFTAKEQIVIEKYPFEIEP